MRWTRPCWQRLTKLQDKYKLVEYNEVPKPLIVSKNSFCKCEFPPDKQINYEKSLYGTKSFNWKHVLVHSDVKPNDWLSKVELMPTEIISSMNIFKRSAIDPMYPVMISNICLQEPDTIIEKDQKRVLVYPDNKYYHITENDAEAFMKEKLNPNPTTSEFKGISNTTKTILICGHAQRDVRCGMIAPLLKEEFEFNLSANGLLFDPESNPNGVKVGIVSHIGGHAYAGNVLYFDEDGLTIWYGRVENHYVDAIVSETIVKKNIIKELYRGRY